MIVSSRFAKVTALSLAGLAHAAIALALIAPEDAKIEGASGGAEVRLGNAFADMVQGTLTSETADSEVTPETPPETAETAPPETVQPTEAEVAEAAAPPETTAPERPEETARDTPQPAARSETVTPAEAPRPQETAREPAPQRAVTPPVTVATPAPPDMAQAPVVASAPLQSTPPLKAETARPLAPQPEPEPVERAETAEAVTTPKETTERLTGDDPDTAKVTRSLRPKQRSAAFEKKHKVTPQPKRKKQAAPAKRRVAEPAPKRQQKKASQAGAKQNTRAGTTSGKAQATARSSGSGGKSKSAGNAAASNYPGLVMRRISRAGRPRVNSRGAAVVAFSISSGGGLSSVSVARSSGSSALDRAAVRVVRTAAPFPKPPAGARRSFTIKIQGR